MDADPGTFNGRSREAGWIAQTAQISAFYLPPSGKRISNYSICKMKTDSLIYLHQLESEIELLRKALGASARGEILFQAPQSIWSEKDIVVEADGDGGAKLLIVEGNYPADYTIYKEKRFKTEKRACDEAEKLCPLKNAI